MLDFTPDPIALQLGPLPVYWYGIGYALGLAAVYLLLTRLAKRAGEDPDLVGNGMIVIAIAALIGGRLYHVIDQWALYKDDLLKIVLPPYTGLGVYGGIIVGIVVLVWYTRRLGVSFWRWADIIAPALFLMQAIARWGNFFNQELYGPPTTLPWGIPIECQHRIPAYPCAQYAFETTRFHPLFLYESLSGLLGLLFLLWVGRRFRDRLRPGDIVLLFFVWYGIVRFLLELLRADNWTFFGVPTAMLVSGAFILGSLIVLAWRHRPGTPRTDPPPSFPELATWGAVGDRSSGAASEGDVAGADWDDDDDADLDHDDRDDDADDTGDTGDTGGAQRGGPVETSVDDATPDGSGSSEDVEPGPGKPSP
jgi:phosphatidylglycerol---prolipoprotein diacylglyceryl transferase